jgi:NAD(P)H-hydrate epimerase
MSRLTGKKIPFIERHRQKIAQQFSRQWQVSVVLKDAHSLVVYNSKTYINSSGNPGMASGGMGDVLTGMLAAFSAQNIPLEDAVFIHGAAGDLASQEKGEYAMIASDLIEYIPYAIQKYS